MTLQSHIDKALEEFNAKFIVLENIFGADEKPGVRRFIRSKLTELAEDMGKEREKNIGQLRQWLNEDRITEPDRMITNEQIKTFLEK